MLAIGRLTLVSITLNRRPAGSRRHREALGDIERYVREIEDIDDDDLAEEASAALWDLLLVRKMRLQGPARPGEPVNPHCLRADQQ